jgi:Rps23 Pro-64 3,4-dihydroxylase Tpa1-like proline 4-hydroxylase
MNQEFEIDPARLKSLLGTYGPGYNQASPFPHVVMEGFAVPEMLQKVVEEFPTSEHPDWDHMNDRDQNKFASNDTSVLGPATRRMIQALNGREVINFLQELTGIQGLVPDPHLAGGGLHEIRRGGKLRVHADFNYHKEIQLDRRINLLLYLNHDWEEEFGGALELWDTEMKAAEQKVLPLFNRCVVFTTTGTSFHGHPDPLTCPEDRSRRSIAMYYYTRGRPESEVNEVHGTVFKKRAGEGSANERRKDLVRSLVPPIIWEPLRKWRTGA